ncbi:MAG: hypothetical protein ACM37Z_02345 [Deltaproteobacteria bacterium]
MDGDRGIIQAHWLGMGITDMDMDIRGHILIQITMMTDTVTVTLLFWAPFWEQPQ